MRNDQMNSESHPASNVPKCLVQLAVLRLVPALDLMIELMMVEATLEPVGTGNNNGSECKRLHKLCQWINAELIKNPLSAKNSPFLSQLH